MPEDLIFLLIKISKFSLNDDEQFLLYGYRDDNTMRQILLQKVDSFQDVLKSKTSKPITVFTMNNDTNLNFDDYNSYSKTHQLDVVTNNPKIRTIYLP